MNNMYDGWWTIKEAAHELNMTAGGIQLRIHNGWWKEGTDFIKLKRRARKPSIFINPAVAANELHEGYTTEEAAKIFCVGLSTVEGWISKGLWTEGVEYYAQRGNGRAGKMHMVHASALRGFDPKETYYSTEEAIEKIGMNIYNGEFNRRYAQRFHTLTLPRPGSKVYRWKENDIKAIALEYMERRELVNNAVLVTYHDAMKMLGVTRQRVWQHAQQGNIQTQTIEAVDGHYVYFVKSSIEKYLVNRRRKRMNENQFTEIFLFFQEWAERVEKQTNGAELPCLRLYGDFSGRIEEHLLKKEYFAFHGLWELYNWLKSEFTREELEAWSTKDV